MEYDKGSESCHRSARPYYADPTANTAIANIMREEKARKKKPEQSNCCKVHKKYGGKKHV